MPNDPLFNVEMPRWWDRLAFLWRGLWLGFLLGYLFGAWAPPNFNSGVSMIVVATCLIAAVLPVLPKAWIEQRNRIRAARSGRLMADADKPTGAS